jgi:hypothetical protein
MDLYIENRWLPNHVALLGLLPYARAQEGETKKAKGASCGAWAFKTLMISTINIMTPDGLFNHSCGQTVNVWIVLPATEDHVINGQLTHATRL